MDSASRIRVGLFFNARRDQGGLYQYALTLVDCLHRFVPEFDYSLYHASLQELQLELSGRNWRWVKFSRKAIQSRLALEALLLNAARAGLTITYPLIPEYPEIQNDSPQVMIYVKPGVYPFQWKYPCIFPIHDLQHRLQPEFPEVSAHGERRRREYFYTRSIPRAAAILTDSETGKEDVVNCYGAGKDGIFSIPYIAPTFRSAQETDAHLKQVRDRYSLPPRYFFYPAAFWEHKNHLRLIKAIAWLAEERGGRIPLVLAGSKRGGYRRVASLVEQTGINDIVHFIGYVPDDDMAALYSQALALVMPTFFGPTNIPILEAWAAECAVITSDLRGIREQVGDAGLLIDPTDIGAIADAIWSIYESPALRRGLIERGRARVAQWTPQKFAGRLADAIRYSIQHSIHS